MLLIKRISLLVGVMFISLNVGGQNFTISGGHSYSIIVCSEGLVYTWGDADLNYGGISSFVGSLGIDSLGNENPSSNTPVRAHGLARVTQADAGSGDTPITITCDGYVITWGENAWGELGNGTQGGYSAAPQYVQDIGGGDTLRDVKYVSGANNTMYAITGDDRVVSWGSNGALGTGTVSSGVFFGSLGHGSILPGVVTVPQYVIECTSGLPIEDVIQIEGAESSGFVIVDPDGDGVGTVYSWGNAENGILGRGIDPPVNGGTSPADAGCASPVLRTDGSVLDDIVSISAADQHVLAIDVNGNVYSWGGEWARQLGRPRSYEAGGQPRNRAALVYDAAGTGLLGDSDPIVSIAAGNAHSIAVTAAGYVYTWGSTTGAGYDDHYNSTHYNQNPDGTPNIDGGFSFPSGALGNGCYPYNFDYNLGTQFGDYLNHLPVLAESSPGVPITGIAEASDGDFWSFLIGNDGEIYGAGLNVGGQLGLGDNIDRCYFEEIPLPGCSPIIPCPEPQLGIDRELCPGFSLDLSSGLMDAGFLATWYHNGIEIFRDSSEVPRASVLSSVTEYGTYVVDVVDYRLPGQYPCTPCPRVIDTLVISPPDTLQQDTFEFCGLTDASVDVAVVGAGPFEWFDSYTGGNSLGTGNTITVDLNDIIEYYGVAPYRTGVVYVEQSTPPPTVVNSTMGAATYNTLCTDANAGGPWQTVGQIEPFNVVSANFTLDSLTFVPSTSPSSWTTPEVRTFQVTVRDAVGTIVYVGPNVAFNATPRNVLNGNSTPEAYLQTIPVNFSTTTPGVYSVQINPTDGGTLWYRYWCSRNIIPDAVTNGAISTLLPPLQDPNAEINILNWYVTGEVSDGSSAACDRTPIFVIERCPCDVEASIDVNSDCTGETELVGSYSSSYSTVDYHFEWEDSSVDSIRIVNPTALTVYSLTVTDNIACSSVITIEVTPSSGSSVLAFPDTLTLCDDGDGTVDFDLTDADATVLGGQTGLTVTYHATQADADNGVNPLLSPYATSGCQVVYARVGDDSLCHATSEVLLNVLPLPVGGFSSSDVTLCPEGGSHSFSLCGPTQGTITYFDGMSNQIINLDSSGGGTGVITVENTTSLQIISISNGICTRFF